MTQPTPDSEDPSNTAIEDLLAPLSPDDDVFALVNPQDPPVVRDPGTDGD